MFTEAHMNGFNTLYFSPGPLLSSTSSNKPIPVRRFGLISDIHLDLSIEQCLHFNSTLYRYCTASGLQMIAITTLVHLTKLTTLIVVHTWQTILVRYTISWRAISITGKKCLVSHNSQLATYKYISRENQCLDSREPVYQYHAKKILSYCKL